MLWIAFRLYLWHIGHNGIATHFGGMAVVNCFQIVSLTYWSQRLTGKFHSRFSCELLSDCIFDILVTTKLHLKLNSLSLWIAFRLYLWHIGHNGGSSRWRGSGVVNCFQIVSLTYWSQLYRTYPIGADVVNCFQIVSLTYWSQQYLLNTARLLSCELLSDCIFDILVTTLKVIKLSLICCELLSDCIFDILVTTLARRCHILRELWIAFRLYLWHIGHNSLR